MEKDNGGKDNVVNLHPKYDSHYRADGSALLTDKLDPVLFVEYVKLKKMFDEAIAEKEEKNKKKGMNYMYVLMAAYFFIIGAVQFRSLFL